MPEISDEGIITKHRRISGSLELKYPPNESRCKQTCGIRHDPVMTAQGEKMVEHRCVLALEHQPGCQFSSACGSLRDSKTSLAA